MTVETLMTQPATLRKVSGESQGPTGEVTPTYTDVAFFGYFEPEAPIGLEGEDIQNRNTQMGRWFGAAPAGLVFTGFDVILYDGQTMDLTGPPRPIWNPRLGAVSHLELSLRVVE